MMNSEPVEAWLKRHEREVLCLPSPPTSSIPPHPPHLSFTCFDVHYPFEGFPRHSDRHLPIYPYPTDKINQLKSKAYNSLPKVTWVVSGRVWPSIHIF